MKLSAAQMRKIYKLSNELGLENDVLHSFIWAIAKKESVKELSIKEAVAVIDYLSGKGDGRSDKPRFEVMSEGQKGMLLHLAFLLGWTREDKKRVNLKRLDAYVRKEYATINFFALSRSNASKCIEALKAMLDRKEKKYT